VWPGRSAPGPLKFAARFVAGSAAGAAFVPIAAVLALRARRERAGA
jgi:MPBQ/MSBQ methyltransferase